MKPGSHIPRIKRSVRFPILAALVALVIAFATRASAAESRPKVMVHYMPWFASKPFSGSWGWHWTMDRFDPDKTGADGSREIASHDYPLIGPYDSADPDVLEYHALLMKLAGVDGVIIDWYGIADHNDYAAIHRNAGKLIPVLKRAGLEFAVCYEDRSVREMIKGGVLKDSAANAQGREVMAWLAKHWFADEAYVTLEGRPLLLVFGPLYFDRTGWKDLTAGFPEPPLLHGLPHLAGEAGFDGSFGWPPVAGGKRLSPPDWKGYMERLHAGDPPAGTVIASAFPGYHDIYEEAGLHESYGSIPHRGVATFQESFELARASGSAIIQIATWNDFGEGTVIEPARKSGYRYLEELQKHSRPSARFEPADLRLPLMLHELRNKLGPDPVARRELDRAAGLLFAAKCAEARSALESLGASLGGSEGGD